VIYGIKTVVKYLLGTDRVERNFAVFPDDTMIVSYPRSGNTWTRFLVANLLHPDQAVSFANIEHLIPDAAAISSRALKRVPRPRVIKCHEYFDHRYPRVIYIVRDPRDVALSFYNFQRKYRQIADGLPLERYVDDFVNGRLNSASWGTWSENVASWVCTRGKRSNFLLLRFEDMLQDTERELKRIAEFLALSPTAEMLERTIENCSADRMRQLEKQEENQWAATRKHRKDIPFVGAAKAGGWRAQLSEASILQIESAWGDLMTSLGYSLVSRRVPQSKLSALASR
jgi:hypothetical protein